MPHDDTVLDMTADGGSQSGVSCRLPTCVHLLLNDKCTAKCVFCGADYFHSRSGETMTLERVRRIAAHLHLHHYGRVVLSGGGDPLTCPDLIPILNYLDDAYRNVAVWLTTNGIGLNTEISQAIVRHRVATVNISLNAATRNTYRQLMQVDAFDLVCRQARHLVALRREHRSPLHLVFSIPIMRCNVEELPRMVELASDVGADSVAVSYCRFYPRQIRNDNGTLSDRESLFYHQALSDRVVRQSAELAKSLGVLFDHEPLFEEEHSARPCTWPDEGLLVAADGTVFPCCGGEVHFKRKVEGATYNFGNALTQAIEEFWNNDAYRAVRISSRQGGICPVSECRECVGVSPLNERRGHIMEWAAFADCPNAADGVSQADGVSETPLLEPPPISLGPNRAEPPVPAGEPSAAARLDELLSCFSVLRRRSAVLVWGAGSAGRRARRTLEGLGVAVCGFVDSDPRKAGLYVDGLLVRAPDAFATEFASRTAAVAIASMAHGDISRQLAGLGWCAGSDYTVVPDWVLTD